jgi:enoyl-CoA hydratase/carnithine racemase
MSIVNRRITFDQYKDKYDYVTLRRVDGILEIRLHDKGDDTSPVVWSTYPHGDLSYLFYDVSRDYENECVIITGSGDTFIGSETMLGEPIPPLLWDEVYHNCKHLQMNLLNIEVPVIAAVNGPAQVHAELALLNDIVLCTETAEFQDAPHFLDNVVPGDGVQVVFPTLMGPIRAHYFMLTGQALSAQRAYELGLVNEILPKGELLERAWYWARFIAARSTLCRRYARSALTQQWKKLILDSVSHGIAMEGLSGSISWGMNNAHVKPNVPGHLTKKNGKRKKN